MSSADSLVAEVREAFNSASQSRRSSILTNITQLFLERAAVHSPDQVAVFDGVFNEIAEHAQREDLIALGRSLAPLDRAPPTLMRKLAAHTDIRVSCVALKKSAALSDSDLAQIASTSGPAHLLAIAGRDDISEQLTDILIGRGDIVVMRKFAVNERARVSHVGFVKLINAAKRDHELTEIIAARQDLPDELKPFIEMLRHGGNGAEAADQTTAAA
jgi:uncharacterized protein (DUF2336 family)